MAFPTQSNEDTRPLVQAPIESPLNLAHTFSRKADMLTKSRKYDDAINCHRRAAEFLLQAMKGTECTILRESMALQHKAYLSQIHKLEGKSQLLDLVERTNKTTSTVSRASQTDCINSVETPEEITATDEETVYQILRENDHNMSQIFLKSSEKSDSSQTSVISLRSDGESSDDKKLETSCESNGAIKVDATLEQGSVISADELVKMNEKLSAVVRSLLQELEATKAEKKKMEKKLGDSQEFAKLGSESMLKFSSLDLPPLEVSFPELANS